MIYCAHSHGTRRRLGNCGELAGRRIQRAVARRDLKVSVVRLASVEGDLPVDQLGVAVRQPRRTVVHQLRNVACGKLIVVPARPQTDYRIPVSVEVPRDAQTRPEVPQIIRDGSVATRRGTTPRL